jgi:hypothetical protein
LVGQGIAELRRRHLNRQAELAEATRAASDASRILLEACEHPLVFRLMAPVIRASCHVIRHGGKLVVAGAGRKDQTDRQEVARVCVICGFREDREPDGDSMPWSSPPSEYEDLADKPRFRETRPISESFLKEQLVRFAAIVDAGQLILAFRALRN